jgi:diketogulonate reductase-like aldo/keto reductase
MRSIKLKSGQAMPVFGLGTWRMGERAEARKDEADVLRYGLDRGITLIDTAEMYGEGGAEEVVGDAMTGRRDKVFLVSKVYPQNASRHGVKHACERSLKRLRTDRIDVYLLHWRGNIPLSETVAGFEELRSAGKIASWGVSNLGVDDIGELEGISGGDNCVVDQVLYNLDERGLEFDLLPLCRKKQIPLMAYSPLFQGDLDSKSRKALATVAQRHGKTPAQIALAWLLRHPDVIVIPKTSKTARIDENLAALEIDLSGDDLAALDKEFPPPTKATPLSVA